MDTNNLQKTITIFDPADFSKHQTKLDEGMMASQVPIEAITAGMTSVLKECGMMFEKVQEVVGKCQLAHVDLSLAIGVDGSVGLFGTKVSGEAKGGVVVRLTFEN